MDGVRRHLRVQRSKSNAVPLCRAVGAVRQCTGTLRDPVLELTGWMHRVDQAPFDRALSLDPFGDGREEIRQVSPDLALVDDAGQAAGPRQDSEQRSLWQAHRGVPVVDQKNLVAGEGELVAATGADAVERGDELETGVLARVLDRQPRLVGELAEVHLPARAWTRAA